MKGQTETIRIIVVCGILGQPRHAYKYEVAREDSPNFQAVDDAFAMNDLVAMRRDFVYAIRFAEAERGAAGGSKQSCARSSATSAVRLTGTAAYSSEGARGRRGRVVH